MMETASVDRDSNRILTLRSLLFGLLGVFIMSGLAGYHDNVLGGTLMIGNHMPGGAFSYFMFLGIGWNGFWVLMDRVFKAKGAIRDVMALSMRELVLVLVVTLVACFPPTSGFYRYFQRMIMLPWYYLQNRPDWVTHELLTTYLRPDLFPAPWPGGDMNTQAYDTVYRGFFTGLASGSNTLPLSDLPLRAWIRPMVIWGPLVILMSVCSIALQFLVHRQWSKYEQLSYPIAQVAGGFCRMSGPRGVPDIFKNRLFWWGFFPVLTLLMIMYLSAWYPQDFPELKEMMPNLKSWWLPVTTQIPILRRVPATWAINGQTIFFTILGLAYFVSSEISLTMGLSTIILAIIGSLYYLGTGTPIDGAWLTASRAGAYLGYSLILLYTGRSYYQSVFGQAFGLRRGARAEPDGSDDEAVSIMAARVLVLAFVAFTLVLSWMCQSWLMALFYSLALMILFLVLTRIVCESGIPFVQAGWAPAEVLLKLMGPAALGPHALTFLMWSSGILVQDPREALMPYVATGIKVAEDAGLKLRRLFWIVIAAVVLALVVAFLSTSYTFYNFNAMSDGWASNYPPVMYLDATARSFNEMKATGVFETSLSANPLGRLRFMRGEPMDARFFVYGIVAVIGFSVLRFRFSKFPFHPIFFLAVGTYPCSQTWGSFLAGWFIKTLVVRFGGGSVYQRLKPLFIGLIAAELAMVGFSVFIDFLYFHLHGSPSPIHFSILPG